MKRNWKLACSGTMARSDPRAVAMIAISVLISTIYLRAAPIDPPSTIAPKPVEIVEQKTADHGFAVTAVSKVDWPVTVNVNFPDIDNLKCSVELPITAVIPARKKLLLARLSLINPRVQSGYHMQWTYFHGARGKMDDSPFSLPFKAGYAYRIAQGFNGQFSHQGRNAIDFAMPEGSTICAARDGTVVEVVQSFTAGGIDENLKDKANHLIILHQDGTTAQYAHLQHNGSKVKVGQKIHAGDEIGLSGATGYARGPHLHFEVDRPPVSGNESESIAMKFIAQDEKGGETSVDPKEGDLLERPGGDADSHKLPINAIENLVTCRKVEGTELIGITDSFSAREPMYVAMRVNCSGFHDGRILIFHDGDTKKNPAVFEEALSNDSSGKLLVLKLDLPDEQSKIRGKCIVRVVIDNEEAATAHFDVGS